MQSIFIHRYLQLEQVRPRQSLLEQYPYSISGKLDIDRRENSKITKRRELANSDA